jgi:hypothetical protein
MIATSRRILTPLVIIALAASVCHAGLIHRYSFNGPAVKDSVGNVDATLKGTAFL